MTVSRAKTTAFLGLMAVLAGPAIAQTSAPLSSAPPAPIDTSRDASFMPPTTTAPIIITAPTPTYNSIPTTTPAAAPPAVTVPVTATPATVAPVATAPALTAPSTAPSTAATTTALPSATAVPAMTPALIAKPVEAASIGNIDPESIGLIANAEGGLGADMWKNTSRAMVAKLFAALNLPTISPTLNHLAQRLLLTTASVPEGTADNSLSLSGMRVEKLLALGDAADAWKLAALAKPDQIDEITLRLVAEAALLSPQRDDVCAKLPDIVKVHSGVEWQKLMLVCQLRGNDMKAAQVTLDLLHAQNIRDDIFFYVAEKNIMGNNKQLPRQLTPLKPLTLALLRISDSPLPGEIYVHPDATMIPELLSAKAREDVARVGLAERAAERGLISSADLISVYHTSVFPPEAVAIAANSSETGPRLHAMLYQAALQEKNPQNRLADAAKYMQTISPSLLNGAGAQVLVEMLGDLPATADSNPASAMAAHIYMLAGKSEAALEWLKLAKHAAIGLPAVADDLNSFWPLTVFSGLESDNEFASDLAKWLDAFLKSTDSKADPRIRHDQAASILLLLDADGFRVPEDAWFKVVDAPTNEKRILPSALFVERLRSAGTSPRRGETVLLALVLSGNSNDIPTLSVVEAVRALRMTGLTADAAALAREEAHSILMPPK